jgi:protein tyrosine phosphatase (PTP) superfamily phosphohydrolase (DUF442 family)
VTKRLMVVREYLSCSGRVLLRSAVAFWAVMMSLGLSMAGWAEYLAATGNFHTVIPGVLYRSAELSGSGFQRVIGHFHIHTVINLRGADPGHSWYDTEAAAVLAAGARHVDLRISATHVPSAAKVHEIQAVLAHAEPPILIHCQGGADRSGLVAALYELRIAHRQAAEAGAQLSFAYGHVPWLGSRTAAMDEAWRNVVRGEP